MRLALGFVPYKGLSGVFGGIKSSEAKTSSPKSNELDPRVEALYFGLHGAIDSAYSRLYGVSSEHYTEGNLLPIVLRVLESMRPDLVELQGVLDLLEGLGDDGEQARAIRGAGGLYISRFNVVRK